jgi:hypothetical protein
LRRYNFRKPRRQVGLSEQVNSISNSNFEENHKKDDLQQQQQFPLHQEEHTHEHILERIHIPNKKHTKRTNQQAIVANLCRKKMRTN